MDMIIKINPDKEKVRSMLNLVKNREKFVSTIDIEKFSTIAVENYYEIVKELATALLLSYGFKAMGEESHKDLIDCLSNYGFNENEILIMNDLRIKRNKSSYEGKQIESTYLSNRKNEILNIIKKLKEKIII